MNLLNIPVLPKLSIFRYLNIRTLNKVRLTNSVVNNFVVTHRHRLVRSRRTEFGAVKISEKFDEMTKNSVYSVEIVLRKMIHEVALAHRFKFEDFGAKTIEVRSSKNSSFFQWLMNTFFDTPIGILEFHKFRLSSKDVDTLPLLLKRFKIKITTISLSGSSFVEEDVNSIPRFLECIRPVEIYIDDTEQDKMRKLLTPQFYQMVFPWLNTLCLPNYMGELPRVGNRVEDIPSDVHRFPIILFTQYSEIIPFEAVKRAFHMWWNCQSEIKTWVIPLPSTYTDVDVVAKHLALPHLFGVRFRNRRCAQFFRPTDNKKLIIAFSIRPVYVFTTYS